MNRLQVAIFWTVIALVLPVSAELPQPLLQWDVNSWAISTAAMAPGTAFVPNTGSFDAANGETNGALRVGLNASNPVRYVASGAGAGDRAYVYLDGFSYVDSPTRYCSAGPSSVFGNTAPIGYTEIGYYYLDSAALGATDNAGIGGKHDSGGQNVLLSVTPGGSLLSSTALLDTAAVAWVYKGDDNLGVVVPRDTWFMIAKVVDLTAVPGKCVMDYYVYYSLDGEEMVARMTSSFDVPETAVFYNSQYDGGEAKGWIGSGVGRQPKGVGFSYYSLYSGQLDPDQIGQMYASLTTAVPEPATMTLLSLGGLALLRRRR